MASSADDAFRILTARLATDLRMFTELRARPMQDLNEKLGDIPSVLRHAHASGTATIDRRASLFLDTGRSADPVPNPSASRTNLVSFSNASSEEAHAYGVRVWGETFSRLSPEQKQFLFEYTQYRSTEINDTLRKRYTFMSHVYEQAARLDEILRLQPVAEPIEVIKTIRSVRLFPDRNIAEVEVGDRGEFLDFVSTALHRDGIEEIKHLERRDVDATIEVPTGTPAIYIGDHSAEPRERELLLGRELGFEVISKPVRVDGRWQTDLRILPGPSA